MKGRLRGAGWTALAATMLALSPARAHAQPDDDPSNPRTGRPTPEAIQGANGATPAKGVEGDSTEAARQDEGVEDAGVSTRQGDPLALAPAALEARVTRPPFGSRVVRLSGAMWLGAPQCTGGDTTAARRACLADRERSLPRRLFALDLHSADGTAIEGSRISGSITVAGGAAAASGAPSRWTATFPLAGVRSGKYTGRILLPRDSGLAVSSVTIPVTLHVRDSPLWPLLVLLSGLLLVMALRKYRDGRLEQDNRYLEIADAEALIVTDPHLADPAGLAAPFRERLASLLRAAVTRVEKGASGPIAELKEADALWLAWQAGRPSWVAGLEMDRSGIERLTRAATERAAAGYGRSRHLQRLLKLLAMAYNDAPPSPPPPGDEGPAARPGAEAAAYRAGAADRAVLVTRYFSLAARIAQFRAEAGAIADPAARAKLLAVLDEVSAEWNEADPEDEGSDALLGELHARAEAARTQSLPA
ncbi:MAG TPA: hypothetical protein VK420_16320, partial [Longimicrobium sp.]|nr:hypothetical protein [Longimicrobium sp.]